MYPTAMRASVLRGVHDVVVEERPVPAPGPHEVDLDRLVTHRFGLAEVAQALTVSARDETAVKAVVRPQE